jgi:hypothetical protein
MTSISKTIDILGYFDRGNSGDEAFKDAYRTILGYDDLNFCSTLTSRKINFSHSYSTAILGGGDVVAPFFLNKIPVGRRFVMYSVGLKYEQSSIDAMLEREADIVYTFFRNRVDVELCHKAGIYNCKYAPDMVFSLAESFLRPPADHIIPDLPHEVEFIIVSLADHYNYSIANRELYRSIRLEHRKHQLALALDTLAKDNHIVFFPLSCCRNHLDNRFHYDVWKMMKRKERTLFLRRHVSPLESIGFFSLARAVISMKLHGVIYGLVSSTPTVNIGVGRKQRLLFKEANLNEQYVSEELLTAENILRSLSYSLTESARNEALLLRKEYFRQVMNTKEKLLSFFAD